MAEVFWLQPCSVLLKACIRPNGLLRVRYYSAEWPDSYTPRALSGSSEILIKTMDRSPSGRPRNTGRTKTTQGQRKRRIVGTEARRRDWTKVFEGEQPCSPKRGQTITLYRGVMEEILFQTIEELQKSSAVIVIVDVDTVAFVGVEKSALNGSALCRTATDREP
jgi:hypothetical protein